MSKEAALDMPNLEFIGAKSFETGFDDVWLTDLTWGSQLSQITYTEINTTNFALIFIQFR